jgi:hypothetical protein
MTMKTKDLTTEQIERLLAWYAANHTHEEYTATTYWKNVYRRGRDDDENNDAWFMVFQT